MGVGKTFELSSELSELEPSFPQAQLVRFQNGKVRIHVILNQRITLNYRLFKDNVFRWEFDPFDPDILEFDTFEEAREYMAWLHLEL